MTALSPPGDNHHPAGLSGGYEDYRSPWLGRLHRMLCISSPFWIQARIALWMILEGVEGGWNPSILFRGFSSVTQIHSSINDFEVPVPSHTSPHTRQLLYVVQWAGTISFHNSLQGFNSEISWECANIFAVAGIYIHICIWLAISQNFREEVRGMQVFGQSAPHTPALCHHMFRQCQSVRHRYTWALSTSRFQVL